MRMMDRRLRMLFAFFSLLFLVAFARAFWIQGVRGGELQAEARSQQTNLVVIPGLRGRLIDGTGRVLAMSENAASVIATPYQVEKPAQVAGRLAPILDRPASELNELLSDPNSGFAYLARKVDLRVAQRVTKLGLAGIATVPDSRRIYPQGELAAQVVGAVGTDNQGLTGLEQLHDATLHGTDGEQEVVHDALGEPLRLETVRASSPGEDVRLTIDAAIQANAEEVVTDVGERFSAKGAAAIVMNPKSGEILALANWPTFDPQNVADASEDALLNRATGFTYEPGSTFKEVPVSAALEQRLVTPNTRFTLPPTIQVADRVIGESHARGQVSLSVANILAQSSNVGAVKIGLELGAERLDTWIRRLGFGEPTGIELPGEENGIVPDLDDYSGSTIGNLPIGQGLLVTPMQMAAAYSAIANGGRLRVPRLVSQVGPALRDRLKGPRVISARTAGQLRRMLRGVLAPGGTASEVSVPGYQLAGKTGTAQKVVDGTYSDTQYVASFVGFAPALNPKLLVAVVVDEPVGIHTGGAVAAPAFGRIASFALPYLGISPG